MTRLVLGTLLLTACSNNTAETSTANHTESPIEEETSADDPSALADVIAVDVSGSEGSYTFAVTLSSPDTGCDRYANWWEVLDRDGNLIYRRILGHSRVDEQPFTRSGGPVDVAADQVVFVRAYMHPTGYGGIAFTGTAADGFQAAPELPSIDPGVESADPQPDGCAF